MSIKVTFCLDPAARGKEREKLPVELSDEDRASVTKPTRSRRYTRNKSHRKYSITPEVLQQTENPLKTAAVSSSAETSSENSIAITQATPGSDEIALEANQTEQPLFTRLVARLQFLLMFLSQNLLRKGK
ncbi:MAG: hypothetical protein VYC39_07115 [Myxococcota bacterium]|nr:hypothetical protein [Myxococcota bacterium]